MRLRVRRTKDQSHLYVYPPEPYRVLNPWMKPGPPEGCRHDIGAKGHCNRYGIGCPIEHEDYARADANWGEVLRLRALVESYGGEW